MLGSCLSDSRATLIEQFLRLKKKIKMQKQNWTTYLVLYWQQTKLLVESGKKYIFTNVSKKLYLSVKTGFSNQKTTFFFL